MLARPREVALGASEEHMLIFALRGIPYEPLIGVESRS